MNACRLSEVLVNSPNLCTICCKNKKSSAMNFQTFYSTFAHFSFDSAFLNIFLVRFIDVKSTHKINQIVINVESDIELISKI